MKRVLILTASYGEGHNAAARNLATAFDRCGGEGTARLMDPFAETSPRRDQMARAVYSWVINRSPRLWSVFYRWLDRTQPLPGKLWLLRREMRGLRELIEREQPAAVCCTYPVFAFMLNQLAVERVGALPIYNVVTDSISINSVWWLAPCNGWFLPNEDSAQVLRNAAIPPERLHVMGFPVPLVFSDPEQRRRAKPFSGGIRPKVLFIINSGSHRAIETSALLLEQTDWAVTIAVGRDADMRRRIERLAVGRVAPCEVLGWTNRIPDLLMTHHVVISKAGGATTQEAIAAHCPMVVNQVVPGQEEGNYELLRRHDIGGRAETAEGVVQLLREAFAADGRGWEGWHQRVRALARPAAATDIARFVLERHRPSASDASHSIEPETTHHE